MTPDLRPLLAFAHELADLARPIARAHFRALPGVDQKDDRTPVTVADRSIETSLRARIAARFPQHGILGEEHGSERLDAEWLWVLDPIDGTKAFASMNPMFGTLIGLMWRGTPVLGVLDAAALGERWAAARGLGATHQGAPIRVRAPRPLAAAVLYCTTAERVGSGFDPLRARVQWTCLGGDCLAYAFVAMGGADLLVDRGLKPYDWCALVPIVQEAGGVITDWQGRPLDLQSPGDVVAASDPALATAARRLVTA